MCYTYLNQAVASVFTKGWKWPRAIKPTCKAQQMLWPYARSCEIQSWLKMDSVLFMNVDIGELWNLRTLLNAYGKRVVSPTYIWTLSVDGTKGVASWSAWCSLLAGTKDTELCLCYTLLWQAFSITASVNHIEEFCKQDFSRLDMIVMRLVSFVDFGTILVILKQGMWTRSYVYPG